MSEEEYINEAITAVSDLVDGLLDLSVIGFEKNQCYAKANELVFWLTNYKEFCLNKGEEE